MNHTATVTWRGTRGSVRVGDNEHRRWRSLSGQRLHGSSSAQHGGHLCLWLPCHVLADLEGRAPPLMAMRTPPQGETLGYESPRTGQWIAYRTVTTATPLAAETGRRWPPADVIRLPRAVRKADWVGIDTTNDTSIRPTTRLITVLHTVVAPRRRGTSPVADAARLVLAAYRQCCPPTTWSRRCWHTCDSRGRVEWRGGRPRTGADSVTWFPLTRPLDCVRQTACYAHGMSCGCPVWAAQSDPARL